MPNINEVLIAGHLGADPEVKYTQSGKAVATLSVATSQSWKDKDGNQHEKTEWHRVVLWGKLAEQFGRNVTKGDQVWVRGMLETRSWDDKDGVKRYTTEIKAWQASAAPKLPQEQTQASQEQTQDQAQEQAPPESELPF